MTDNKKKLLEVKNLKTYFKVDSKVAKAVDGVSFDVFEGEILGLVGESGSGKSVTCLSILRLIPNPPGEIVNGEIFYKNKDLLKLPFAEIQTCRGFDISMIFQEPMTSLNPVFTIKMQMTEILKTHYSLSEKESLKQSIHMLKLLGISDPEKRIFDYPHNFSGGMRQRVMIAMALLAEPSLLIADEPTTALDVTIQAQILDLLKEIKAQRKEMSIILITHNLAVVAEICNRVIVMYGGRIQESAPVKEFFKNPAHPYTTGLLNCLPEKTNAQDMLQSIPGNVPDSTQLPKGCKFWPRCEKVMSKCRQSEPSLVSVKKDHLVRCFLYSSKEGSNE